MPEIKDLQYYPRSKLVNIHLSTSKDIVLDSELFLEKGYKKGDIFSDDQLMQLSVLSIKRRLRQHSFNLIAIRIRSVEEIRQKLSIKYDKLIKIFFYENGQLSKQVILEELLGELIERKYLDDREFTRQYIEQFTNIKGKGKRAIIFALQNKGIDKSIIDELIDNGSIITETKTNTLIDKSIDKILRSQSHRNFEKRKIRDLLIRRLLSRGFEYKNFISKIDDRLANEYNDRVN